MGNNQELNPRYGGRNIVSAHGQVNGFFQRHFEVGADGATVGSMAVDGKDLTAAELAKYGLDQPLAAGQIPYVLLTGKAITSIEFSAGGAFMFFNSPNKDQILLSSAEIDKTLPAGYLETLGDNFVFTRVVDGTEIGSFPTWYQQRIRATGINVLCQFDIESDVEIDLPFYVISIKGDGTDTGGNSEAINRVFKKKQRMIGGRVLSADPAEDSQSVGISLENYNDVLEANIRITNISFTDTEEPAESVGVGKAFNGQPFDPDVSSIHANHSIKYDIENKRLVIDASGAGITYFLWNRPLLKNWKGSTTGQSYIKLGTVSAAGSIINAAKDGGADWFSTGVLVATDEENYDSFRGGMVTAGADQFGIKVETIAAGIVEIQEFSFVTGNVILTDV